MKVVFGLLLICSCSVFGQDTKVTTGVVNFEQGYYKKALTALNIALENPEKLKEKYAAKGYYYRGKTYVLAASRMAQNNTAQWTDEEIEDITNNFITLSWSDFKEVAKYDPDDKYTKKVQLEQEKLFSPALQMGFIRLNESSGQGISLEEKSTLLAACVSHIDIAIEINPESYMVHDIRAQALMGQQKYPEAKESFELSKSKYINNKPSKPDLLFGYVYYRLALIERYYTSENPGANELGKAYDYILSGKELVETEFERATQQKSSMSSEDWATTQQDYLYVKNDLEKFELDIYLNWPEKLQEALGKFEKSIADDPDNYTLRIAYASLLENQDIDKAVEAYLKATELDPSQSHAWFNLGALYVNQSAAFFQKANSLEIGDPSYNKIKADGDAMLQKALEPMQKVHSISPCDKETLNALKNITVNLNMEDLYNEYKEKYKGCGY